MKKLDPININLTGRHLIEASAGTGKTYTITGLYLRFILERHLAVENILVVTFTNAACQELKDKIRERLVVAQRRCVEFLTEEVRDSSDKFIDELLTKYRAKGRDIKELENRITLALMDFDLASVYTIHSFCQRVLRDSAFESSFPFDFDLIEDDREFLQQVIDDYWRANSVRWPAYLTDFLCKKKWTPDSLIKLIPPLLNAIRTAGKAALHWPRLLSPANFPTASVTEITNLWQSDKSVIAEALQSPALSKAAKTYRKDNVAAWSNELDNYCQHPDDALFPLNAVEAFSRTALINGTMPSKAGETPEHIFFNLCDDFIINLEAVSFGVLWELLEECQRLMPELKRQRELLSFDDVLSGVHDGLCQPDTGRQLAKRVGLQYPVALIDEFQDTDNLQYDIFKRIYDDPAINIADKLTFMMVGDPKQAIYSFRGADIFSYLTAANAGAKSHTLGVNWRSEPNLTMAVNFLFARHKRPFILEQIKFSKVDSPPDFKARFKWQNGADAPLNLLYFPEQKNRNFARYYVAECTAKRIKNMLVEAAAGRCFITGQDEEKQSVTARDIAVLVRTHQEGELIRQALLAMGLPAIIQSRKSVYHTDEARELELILGAVCHPDNEKKLRAALGTRTFGVTADEFLAMNNNGDKLDSLLQRFAEYKKIWRQRGPAPMLYKLLQIEGVYKKLSIQQGAERILTNIRQLMELLQTVCHEKGLGDNELLAWLSARRHDETNADDKSQIRLESDENLIKIVTIHKSKGLQYPVVFCPFLWDTVVRKNKDIAVICHENNRLVVDLTADNAARIKQQARESYAEELRLLYVAVTRAKHRCYLFWGRVKGKGGWATATSSLQYLLAAKDFGEDDLLTALRTDFKQVEEDFLTTAKICEDSGGLIGLAPAEIAVPEINLTPADENLHAPREFKRQFNYFSGVTSFTALHGGISTPDLEKPDYDFQDHAENHQIPLEKVDKDGFNFPHGAKAGSCLHAILEELDFQVPVNRQENLIQQKLSLFGITDDWLETAILLISNTVNTPLNKDGDLSLARLHKSDMLTEMEFYFPVPAIDNKQLATIFRDGHRLENDKKQHGFMKGFIDLIFCWRKRYYIVDYKSNFLGSDLENYQDHNLTAVMQQAGYDLQYKIYTEALHRYLSLRLKDYDFKKHFGGIYYLFLRGMCPEKGNKYGVYQR